MNQEQKSYFLFVATNRLAQLRRALFPTGTWRETIYRTCMRPVASGLLAALSALRAKPSSKTPNIPKFDRNALPSCDQIKNILVIKSDHIGDFIFALPAFLALRSAFSQAHITLVCGTWNRDLAVASGLFDEVVCVNVYQSRMQLGFSFKPDPTLQKLKQLPVFDIAIDLKHEPDSRFLLNWVQARFKSGFQSPLMPPDIDLVLPFFPLQKAHMDREIHMRTILLVLANAVVATFTAQTVVRQEMQQIATTLPVSQPRFGSHGPVIGINPGSGSAIKNWPLEYFREFISSMIKDYDASIILFGTQAEKDAATFLKKDMPQDNIRDYTGEISLMEFASLGRNLDLYLGHDTGSTHIVAALDTPTLCLFSDSSIVQRVAPTGDKLIMIRSEAQGMDAIPVDQVIKTAKMLLVEKLA